MIVCIDTNALIQLFGRRSRLRAIAIALMDGRIALALSTPILLEYEEVAGALYGPVFAQEVVNFLHLATAAGSVRHVDPRFHFRIITADPDDEIFADRGGGARDKWRQGTGRAKPSPPTRNT